MVSSSASNALNSLANFLDYAELPKSARQVKNFRELLENIMHLEQREKFSASPPTLRVKIENSLWTNPQV